MMKEKDFQAAVVELARLHGWRSYHVHDSRRSEPGFPDLILVRPGVRGVIAAELKTGGRVTTDEQRSWLRDLADAGVEAGLWRPDAPPARERHPRSGVLTWPEIEARLRTGR